MAASLSERTAAAESEREEKQEKQPFDVFHASSSFSD
jgi:hypothetical protein